MEITVFELKVGGCPEKISLEELDNVLKKIYGKKIKIF